MQALDVDLLTTMALHEKGLKTSWLAADLYQKYDRMSISTLEQESDPASAFPAKEFLYLFVEKIK